ncbi:MAG TPA: hypothetical protein VI383_08420 [Gemmatimonadales bacterium]|nr:hypothetical protein [Gemmatimonadales bacterium]
MKKAQSVMSLIVGLVIILVITNLSTDTMNPFEVFRGQNLLLKIVIGFFLAVMGLNILNLLFGGKIYEGEVCAGRECGKGLMAFAAVLGPPIRCMYCKRLFHKKCFQANGGTLRGGCRMEPCPSAISNR